MITFLSFYQTWEKKSSYDMLFLVTHKVIAVLHFSCFVQVFFLQNIFRKNRCERFPCACSNSAYLL